MILLSSQEPEQESRESIRIQALLAKIGARMGLSIWIPRSDRGSVLKEWQDGGQALLDRLPLNYDETTLRTIENIDVLWLRRRSIIRAFEVEHTTSVYSGLLRMADLLALQPNMDIKLHIVAPAGKREQGVPRDPSACVFVIGERAACGQLHIPILRECAGTRDREAPNAPVRFGSGRICRGTGVILGRPDNRHLW
jgi:hypothetical protein